MIALFIVARMEWRLGWCLGARILREAHERRALLRMNVSNDLLKSKQSSRTTSPKCEVGVSCCLCLCLWWFEKNFAGLGS